MKRSQCFLVILYSALCGVLLGAPMQEAPFRGPQGEPMPFQLVPFPPDRAPEETRAPVPLTETDVQEAIANTLGESSMPEVFLRVDAKERLLIRLYAGFECRERGISSQDVNCAIVESLIALHNMGVETVYRGKIGEAISVERPESVLEGYTFNYFRPVGEIEVWWQKYRDQPRVAWARAAVERILDDGEWTGKEHVFLQACTMNVRVPLMSREEFREWWETHKDKGPAAWARESLEWSIRNANSDDESRYYAWQGIILLAPDDILARVRGLEMDEIQDMLQQWYERAGNAYDPLAENPHVW